MQCTKRILLFHSIIFLQLILEVFQRMMIKFISLWAVKFVRLMTFFYVPISMNLLIRLYTLFLGILMPKGSIAGMTLLFIMPSLISLQIFNTRCLMANCTGATVHMWNP